MIESYRDVLVALFNIIDDYDENIESDTDELCAAMEVLPMKRETAVLLFASKSN
jgi:hypothetical protein